mmetsp:Transcript_25925/g.73786  ORF Transcript_25925/g.73786 Transcript_25925/m.73786 type:complete len:361 (-) Transcript_25925:469-1551(-)
MGSAQEVDLVVKHTFLELIRTDVPARARSHTDTDLLGGAIGRTVSDVVSPAMISAPSPLLCPSPLLEAFPMTPLLESTLEHSLPAEVAALADLSATEDLKSALGLEGDGSSTASQPTTEEGGMVGMGLGAFGAPRTARNLFLGTGPEQHMTFPPMGWGYLPCDGYGDCQTWGVGMGAWQHMGAPLGGDYEEDRTLGSKPSVGPAALCAVGGEAEETRTTLMLREMPVEVSRDRLIHVLDQLGMRGLYDMVYVPVDFSSGCGLGYAFVNMTSPQEVPVIWTALDGFSAWGFGETDKPCSIRWSEPNQGLAAHVERYRNSPVMHPEVPEGWKPALFTQGVRVIFPPPTKKLKSPKVRSKKAV